MLGGTDVRDYALCPRAVRVWTRLRPEGARRRRYGHRLSTHKLGW